MELGSLKEEEELFLDEAGMSEEEGVKVEKSIFIYVELNTQELTTTNVLAGTDKYTNSMARLVAKGCVEFSGNINCICFTSKQTHKKPPYEKLARC